MQTPTSRKQYWQLVEKITGSPISHRMNMKYKLVRERVDSYFKLCTRQDEATDSINPTLTGLAYHMGFSGVTQMRKKADGSDAKFSYLIQKAMTLVENYYESMGSTTANAFFIFALKNFGWMDVPMVAQDGRQVSEVVVTIQKGKKRKQLKDGKLVEMKAS